MEKTNYIFVYGTLRSDIGKNNSYARMLRENSEYIGVATVQGILYDVGSFPAIVHGDSLITGELYRVKKEAASMVQERLDAYESNGSLYQREIVPCLYRTVLKNNKKSYSACDAWCYFYLRGTENLDMVESGDYASRK